MDQDDVDSAIRKLKQVKAHLESVKRYSDDQDDVERHARNALDELGRAIRLLKRS